MKQNVDNMKTSRIETTSKPIAQSAQFKALYYYCINRYTVPINYICYCVSAVNTVDS